MIALDRIRLTGPPRNSGLLAALAPRLAVPAPRPAPSPAVPARAHYCQVDPGLPGSSAPGLTVTRPAAGLPMGAELEFADELTLGRAMSGRRSLSEPPRVLEEFPPAGG